MSKHLSPTYLDQALSDHFGVRVYLKPEIYSATGSYKDRMAVFAVRRAVADGATRVVVASSGNQGYAIAHAARAAGLECVVVTTEDMLPFYRQAIRGVGATLQMAPAMESRAAVLQEVARAGYYPLSVSPEQRGPREQPGLEGYARMAEEMVEALGQPPNMLILPVCYGDGCAGMVRGFQRCAPAALPRFLMVRARLPEGQLAYSIATNHTTPEVVRMEREHGAASIFLGDAEFAQAQQLAREAGLNLEAGAAGPFVALAKLAPEKALAPGAVVVLLLTAVDRQA